MQANAAGPGDAFEVALLDADAGLALAGRVDLAGSDALLNRQTERNGQPAVERLASSVRKQVNADGSVTYLVTLAPELAGKSALLSFDLLGFAAADSRITVRDVRLLSDTPSGNLSPTAAGGQVQGMEDQALPIAWSHFAANDADAQPGVLQIEITTLPTDGQLQRQQADGSWAAVAVGDRFSKADLAARGLRFVPAADASGGAGYGTPGDGNRHEHYARIGFRAFDGELYSAPASLVIDIAAVADPSAAALALLADDRGRLDAGATPAPLPRTAAEIAQDEADRARALSDAWLKELEERAKAQWQQLVGGK